MHPSAPERRRLGGRGPLPSMALAASAAPSTTEKVPFPEEWRLDQLTVKTCDSFR